jgi:maltoporin
MKTQRTLRIVAVAAMAAAAGNAKAQFDFTGYFRAGAGLSSEKGVQTCFKAPGAEAKFRLGNECENYGEFFLHGQAYKGEDGSIFKGHVMLVVLSSYQLGDNFSTSTKFLNGAPYSFQPDWRVAQLYFDAVGIPWLSGGKAWIGRRYYKREQSLINDFFYWNPSGNGAGIEDFGVGPLKLSYAIFQASFQAGGIPPTDDEGNPLWSTGSDAGLRHDVQLRGIPFMPGGELQLGFSYTHILSRDEAAELLEDGWSANVQYVQKLLGGANVLFVGYSEGPSPLAANSNITPLKDDLNAKRFRVVDYLRFQLTPELSGELVGLFSHLENTNPNAVPASGQLPSTNWVQAGGRLVYALGEHFKLQAEAGRDWVTPLQSGGGPRRTLTKATFAPTLTSGKKFLARPELRLYVTYARWNDAAGDAGPDTAGLYKDTSEDEGASFGIQAEGWW